MRKGKSLGVHYQEFHMWWPFLLPRRILSAYTVRAMSTLEEYLVPPEAVRGMKVLDRAAFNREFVVPAVRLAEPKLMSLFLKRLSHACFRCPPVKKVQTERSEDGKVRILGKGLSNCMVHLQQIRVCGHHLEWQKH